MGFQGRTVPFAGGMNGTWDHRGGAGQQPCWGMDGERRPEGRTVGGSQDTPGQGSAPAGGWTGAGRDTPGQGWRGHGTPRPGAAPPLTGLAAVAAPRRLRTDAASRIPGRRLLLGLRGRLAHAAAAASAGRAPPVAIGAQGRGRRSGSPGDSSAAGPGGQSSAAAGLWAEARGEGPSSPGLGRRAPPGGAEEGGEGSGSSWPCAGAALPSLAVRAAR